MKPWVKKFMPWIIYVMWSALAALAVAISLGLI